MTAQQNAYLQMFSAVRATVEDNGTAWTTFTPFVTPFNAFANLMDTLPAVLAKQDTTTNGATETKEEARKELEDQVLRVCRTVTLLASMNDDDDMSGIVAASSSKLSKMRDMELVGFGKKVLDYTGTLDPTSLTPLGLTAAMLEATGEQLDTFTALVGLPSRREAKSQTGTKELAQVITELRAILDERLDPAADVLSYTQPGFVDEYYNAREINDPAYRTRSLTVRVSSTAGVQLPDVVALINPIGVTKTTGGAGTFYINNLEAGTYTMLLSANSFQTKTQEFTILDNQATIVNVSMVPES
jgi:hypothetical protein